MGYYENQLKAITSGSAWQITQLEKLKNEMSELQDLMTEIAASPGWTGAAADDAREKLASLRKDFNLIETRLTNAGLAIDAANRALTRADNAHATLPGVAIPDWIYDAVSKATAGTKISIPWVGEFYVETAISRVQEFFGAQRESAAYTALTTLQTELRSPRAQLEANRVRFDGVEWESKPEEPIVPEPHWGGDDNGLGAFGPRYGTGSYGGGNYTSPPRSGPPYVTLPPEPPRGWPHTTIGIDGEVIPGSINGGAGGLSGIGAGGLGGGGGLGAGLIGAGAGGAALLAGSKLASGGGAGIFGGAGAGAGAGGKSSSAMMGGAPGGGGGSEKEKRNGLGLIAPKLEDDDEMGPRSAAAGAGGRE